MSISLSTLTNPATSDSVLLEAQSEADFLEPIVLFKNRATGSNAISNDATQTTANDQPLSLPLIDGDGYLYQPDVTGNAPAVDIPSIAANQDFVFEMEVYLVDAANFHLASGANPNNRFAVYNGNFYFSPSNHSLNSPLSTGASTLTVERSGSTVTLKQDGVTKATIVSGISSHSYDFTNLSFNGQFGTSIGKINGYIKTATLSIEGTEVFNCDFADTSIEDGASSFDCSTGQTVTINTGSGVDQARIVRRPKAVFNNSELDFIHTNVGDAFFVCATESGVVSGVFSTSSSRNKFSGNGALKNSYRTDFLQTLWGMWPNTISDSQKQALVDYAKTKSAGKNWAGIENFIFFFRSSNLKSLDASYWDTGSATSFNNFLRGANRIESLDIRGWDTSSVVTMSLFARGCTSLTNISIDGNTLSDSACTNYGLAFTDTNLNQATIDDILVRINAAGTSNGTFDRTGGEYPSTTGVAAKNALQARGWSMTFSSEVLPSVLDLEPAAAYSLRALKSSEDPNVVRVRRSSDGALSNFKASEVSDGTLTTWVNTEYNRYTSDFSSDVDGWVSYFGTNTPNVDSIGGQDDCLRFVQNAENSYHFIFKTQQLLTDNRYRISAEVYLPSSNTQIDELKVVNAIGDFVNRDGSNSTTTTDEWVTISFEATRTTGGNNHRVDFAAYTNGTNVYQGNGTDTFYVRNVQIDQLTADGHVTTWYDQAGSNDADMSIQANRPKIVDGGTLFTQGGFPALDFDTGNTNSRLATSAAVKPSNLNNFSLFTVQKASGTGGNFGVRTGGAPDNRLYLPYLLSGTNRFGYGDQLSAMDIGSPTTTHQLVSAIAGSTQGNAQAFVNGASQGSTALQDIAPTTNSVIFGSGSCRGSMQEVIMFHNDQSLNRTAIENNINDHFTIYS